jgi:hypothetical protein
LLRAGCDVHARSCRGRGPRSGMGFEEQEDAAAPGGKVFESPDEYVKRLEGHMLLYGAVMQVRGGAAARAPVRAPCAARIRPGAGRGGVACQAPRASRRRVQITVRTATLRLMLREVAATPPVLRGPAGGRAQPARPAPRLGLGGALPQHAAAGPLLGAGPCGAAARGGILDVRAVRAARGS